VGGVLYVADAQGRGRADEGRAMTKPRTWKWGRDPDAYAKEVNAWLDADDARQERAMWDRFDPAEEVARDEMNRLHLSPRLDIARVVSDLKGLPASDPRVAEIHNAIRQIVGNNRELLEYATRLLRAKRGPGNKSRRPRTRTAESDLWAKINQLHDAELMDHFAREAVAIYKRIKRWQRQLHFRRTGLGGLPDDLELSVDRALRAPDGALAEGIEGGSKEAEKRHRSFRAVVLNAASGRLRGEGPGFRRGRKRSAMPKRKAVKTERVPKAKASGAH
jgi:hypothetical protein